MDNIKDNLVSLSENNFPDDVVNGKKLTFCKRFEELSKGFEEARKKKEEKKKNMIARRQKFIHGKAVKDLRNLDTFLKNA